MITDHVAATQEALEAGNRGESSSPATALAGYPIHPPRNASTGCADAIGARTAHHDRALIEKAKWRPPRRTTAATTALRSEGSAMMDATQARQELRDIIERAANDLVCGAPSVYFDTVAVPLRIGVSARALRSASIVARSTFGRARLVVGAILSE
jgi:hypothetical protein